MGKPTRADVEAFHRDFPFATHHWSEPEDRHMWKYHPDMVARARGAAVLRILGRRLLAPVAAVLNTITPKETR